MIVIDLSAGQSVVGEPEKNTVSVITRARPKKSFGRVFRLSVVDGKLRQDLVDPVSDRLDSQGAGLRMYSVAGGIYVAHSVGRSGKKAQTLHFRVCDDGTVDLGCLNDVRKWDKEDKDLGSANREIARLRAELARVEAERNNVSGVINPLTDFGAIGKRKL